MKKKQKEMSLFDMISCIHPWQGTDHCLREDDGGEGQCCNDHTGCFYNDGHNTCGHPAPMRTLHDSPLLKKGY